MDRKTDTYNRMASGISTVVELLIHDHKFKGSNPATAGEEESITIDRCKEIDKHFI
jgi:hypothetical protein